MVVLSLELGIHGNAICKLNCVISMEELWVKIRIVG